jgi:signal transduction histidine kinase
MRDSEVPILDVDEMLAVLQADPTAFGWQRRRSIAQALSNSLANKGARRQALDLLQILARDPKPEVRVEVAAMLPRLDHREVIPFAALLTSDSNAFVRRTAERVLPRKNPSAADELASHLASAFADIEARWGTNAARAARRVTNRFADMLLGMAVHNVRNTLTAMKHDAEALYQELKTDGASQASVQRAGSLCGEVHYVERLVENMRTYARVPRLNRHPERVVDVVDQALRDLGSLTVTPIVEVPTDLFAPIDRNLIAIAIANVVKNAFEALKDEPWQEVRIHTRSDGAFVHVVVEDNGCGMSAEDLSALRDFVPGRTSRKSVGGTGWGLAIAKRYVDAHGGRIGIESEQGEGTTVEIELPLVAPEGEVDES